MGIDIRLDDITTLEIDCIVNAANNSLLGGGGVDGAIHRAAGIGLYNECKKIGGCKTGEAKITKGYNLPAKYVIHTVGPIYSGSKEDAKFLAKCYINSLNLAKKNNIHSIAFPSISTGVYGYPLSEASKIAVKSVNKWLKENHKYAIKVLFCCYNSNSYSYYEKEIKKCSEQ